MSKNANHPRTLGSISASSEPEGALINTNSTRLLLIFLLAGLAVGGWMFMRGESEDWSDIAYDSEGTAEIETEPNTADPVVEPGAVEMEGGRIEVLGDRTSTALPAAKQIDAALGFPVRVVKKGSAEPVPGASILYYDTLSSRYRTFRSLRRQYQEVDKEAVLKRAGERVVTDRDGVAVVPHGIPTQSIVARHGELYGELQVSGRRNPPRGGYVTELERDRMIRVMVVDERDRPINGVHLTFYIGIRDGRDKLRWALLRDAERNTRSRDGVQELPHVQSFVELLKNLSKVDPLVYIGLDVPGMTRCGPAVSLLDIPNETIKIVMSPVGSVTVHVTDKDGEPVVRRVRISTKPDFQYPDLAGNEAGLERHRPKWEQTTDESGRVVFDMVGVGTELLVESVGANVSEAERIHVNGPVNPGENVDVRLIKPFTAALIEGVALGEDGKQLRQVSLSYAAKTNRGGLDTGYLVNGTVRTDADGRFLIRLAPTKKITTKDKRVVEVDVYSKLRIGLMGEGTLHAGVDIDIPNRLEADRYSVGMVQLRLPTMIASGRVYLDDEPMKFFDRFILDFRKPDNRNRWERVEDVVVHGKSGGFFEVRGELSGRRLRLRPRVWGQLPVSPVMLAAGQHDIDIRLYSAGTMRVAVLHDAETADAKMEVMLRPITIDYPQANPLIKWHFIGRLDKRNSGNLNFRRVYWWPGLPPGRYRIELRLLGQSEPFTVLDQLQPTFRRRLDEIVPEVINLRGVIRRVHVSAQDSKGRPIGGLVFPLGQTALETSEGVPMTKFGAILHTTQRDGVDVQVVARGYRTETVYGVNGKRVVRMRPGIPITVDLSTLRVPRGVKIKVRLRRRSYDYKRLYRASLRHPLAGRYGALPLTILIGERNVSLRYRGRRRWKTTVMEHGQFSLMIELSRAGKEPVRLSGYSPSRLMIRDTATEHKFSILFSSKRLAQALEKLGVEPVTRKPRQKKKTPKK